MNNVYSINIENETLMNNNYRKVLFTSTHQQLVVMNLKPGENIDKEVHHEHDQFIRIEKGQGIAKFDNKQIELNDGIILMIPAGSEHEILNSSKTQDLKLYTIYSPPEHPKNKLNIQKPINKKYKLLKI